VREFQLTYLYQKAPLPRVANYGAPHVVAPRQRIGIPDDKERTLGTRQGNVHSSKVSQETDRGEFGTRTDSRQDDDVLFLTLKAVYRIEPVISLNCD
jgi:hypothetical protein